MFLISIFFSFALALIDAKPFVPYITQSIWGSPKIANSPTLPVYSHRSAPKYDDSTEIIDSPYSHVFSSPLSVPFGLYPTASPQAPFLATKHDAQVPSRSHYNFVKPLNSYLNQNSHQQYLLHVPAYPHVPTYQITIPHLRFGVPVPSFYPQHDAQIPLLRNLANIRTQENSDNEIDNSNSNSVLVAHFPTEIAGAPKTANLRNEIVNDEGFAFSAPAGIVQSSQPSFSWMKYTNPKAHPFAASSDIPSDSTIILA